MATIQWRPEVNALTTPQSYRILYLPHNVADMDDIAADVVGDYPNCSQELAKTVLELCFQNILKRLTNGEQVTFPNVVTFSLGFTGRLDSPDDPLPPPSARPRSSNACPWRRSCR